MQITIKQLRRWSACEEQIELVAAMWGSSVEVTREHCLEAADLGLDAWWLAVRILDAPALATYEAACAPARATYEAAYDSALATYKAACASARATYEAARWLALADALGL